MIAPIASAIRLPPQSGPITAHGPKAASAFEAMVQDLTGQDAMPAQVPVKQPVALVADEEPKAKQPPPESLSVPEVVRPILAEHGQSTGESAADTKAPVRKPVEKGGNKPAPGAQLQAPFTSIPVAVPVPPPAVPAPPLQKNEGGDDRTAAPRASNPETAEQAPPADVALQVNIRIPNAVVEAVPLPKQPPLPAIPEAAITPAPAIATAAATSTAPTVIATHTAPAPSRASEPVSSGPAPVPQEPIERERSAQPLKSVTLEFAPDGAGDVRLRVSERAGEVHISLHSSDASLSGRLHEGVHDLVGSLSKAGYDAEAWTPGQGHQGNQRQQEERKQSTASPRDADQEEFAGMYEQQQIQEVS